MRKFLIPNFLFYPNIDNSEIIKNSFLVFKNKGTEIFEIKKKINNFLSFYNFTLIYFYIGNFFIKNKLKKNIKNLLNIGNSFYSISNINLNFSNNLNIFLEEIVKHKKYNVNKVILKLQDNKYYLPLEFINLTYYYFLFFSVFLNNLKLHLVYLNLNLLNTVHIFKNYVNTKSIN